MISVVLNFQNAVFMFNCYLLNAGDSIVVAPSQTLSNYEYHMLRETAIKVILSKVTHVDLQF